MNSLVLKYFVIFNFFFISVYKATRDDTYVTYKELDEIKSSIHQISTEKDELIRKQSNELKELKQMVVDHEIENGMLRRKLHENVQVVTKRFLELNNTVSQLQSGMELMSKAKSVVKRNTDSPVAFYALVKEPILNLGDNQEIHFLIVASDTHNAFDGPTSVFTCPESGYYFFILSIMTYPGTHIEAIILHDGDKFAYVHSQGGSSSYDQGTTGAVEYVNAGDKIWVTVHDDVHIGSGKMIFSHYSTFSGFKI